MQAARRIVYLGDDASTIRSLSAQLDRRGYRLEPDDERCLDPTDWYRLLILDVDSPATDEMQRLVSLRRQFPEHPIIVLCGATEHPSTPLAHALRRGADDVVFKPLTNPLPLLQAVAAGWRLLDYWKSSPPEFVTGTFQQRSRRPDAIAMAPITASDHAVALMIDYSFPGGK